MKKLINVRISLICVVGLILGIVAFHQALFKNYWALAICGTVFVAAIIVFACLKSKAWIWFTVAAVFLCIGFGDFYLNFRALKQNDDVFYGQLVGRVTDLGQNGGDENCYYLEDCTLDGQKVSGRVKIRLYADEEISTGDVLTLTGTLRNKYAVKDQIDTGSIRSNVRYEFSDGVLLLIKNGKLKLDEKARLYVYNVCRKYMPNSSGEAYALLTGDRSAMSDESFLAFRKSGIVHMFVVSGLHVGFIVTVFGFVLTKLKLKPIYQLPVLTVPLLFYAYLCNFTPSVVRALVMTVCMYVTKIVYGRYDLLSSLCWASLIILLAKPLYLYDVGFQLSVMSVFGIATVYLQADRAMKRRNVKGVVRYLLNSLALSFGCVSATLFVSAYYFGEVAYLGILLNIAAIPLVFVAFVFSVVALFPWVFHYVMWLPDKILWIIGSASQFLAKFNPVVAFSVTSVAIVITVFVLFVVGGYVNFSKLAKRIFYGVAAVALACCIVVTYIPKKCDNAVRVFCGYNDTMVVATCSDGQVAVVGEFSDTYAAESACEFVRSRRTNAVSLYLTDISAAKTKVVDDFCQDVKVVAVYKLDFSGNTNLENALAKRNIPVIQVVPNATRGDAIAVQSVFDGEFLGAVVHVENIDVALVTSSNFEYRHFADFVPNADYYVVQKDISTFSDRNLNTISFYQQPLPYNFGANKYGNFTITQKDGKIVLNFRRI